MKRVELIAPKFLGFSTELNLSVKSKNDVKKFIENRRGDKCHINKSIENLLIKINSAKSYEEIPDTVVFSYNNLIDRNIDFKDTLDLINLTAKLTANKFNQKPKEILFTGFASGTIEKDNHEKLVSAGLLGCTASPVFYGIETAAEIDYKHKKDPTYWDPIVVGHNKKIIIEKKSPKEISLTFRQEQIFNMVCKGMTNYQIAHRLSLSESTVKMHIGVILKKYKVQHRSQLIASAIK